MRSIGLDRIVCADKRFCVAATVSEFFQGTLCLSPGTIGSCVITRGLGKYQMCQLELLKSTQLGTTTAEIDITQSLAPNHMQRLESRGHFARYKLFIRWLTLHMCTLSRARLGSYPLRVYPLGAPAQTASDTEHSAQQHEETVLRFACLVLRFLRLGLNRVNRWSTRRPLGEKNSYV